MACDLAVPAPHWYAVDDYRVFVARAQAAQFAHFRHAPLHDLGRARMWNDFPDVPAKNLAGLKAQQVGVGLVDKADNHCPVAKQHAHWQAVQNQGFRRCGFHGYDLLVFVFYILASLSGFVKKLLSNFTNQIGEPIFWRFDRSQQRGQEDLRALVKGQPTREKPRARQARDGLPAQAPARQRH